MATAAAVARAGGGSRTLAVASAAAASARHSSRCVAWRGGPRWSDGAPVAQVAAAAARPSSSGSSGARDVRLGPLELGAREPVVVGRRRRRAPRARAAAAPPRPPHWGSARLSARAGAPRRRGRRARRGRARAQNLRRRPATPFQRFLTTRAVRPGSARATSDRPGRRVRVARDEARVLLRGEGPAVRLRVPGRPQRRRPAPPAGGPRAARPRTRAGDRRPRARGLGAERVRRRDARAERGRSRRTRASSCARSEAIERDPKSAVAYYHLGILLEEIRGDEAGAETAYRKACELDPQYADAFINLGNLLKGDGILKGSEGVLVANGRRPRPAGRSGRRLLKRGFTRCGVPRSRRV